MIHIRAVSPTDITPALVASLSRRPGVLNLIVLGGVARNPDGDAVQFDVITAEANEVLHDMRMLGVARRGSIIIEDVGAELSDRANDAEAQAPRALRLSPVWEQSFEPRQGPTRVELPVQQREGQVVADQYQGP
jgi:hypothetical protein